MSSDGTSVSSFNHSGPRARDRVVHDVGSRRRVDVPEEWNWIQYTGAASGIAVEGDGAVTVFDPDTNEPLGPPIDPEMFRGSIEVSPGRETVAIGHALRNEIAVYDLRSGALIDTLSDFALDARFVDDQEFDAGVFWIDFSPNGDRIAASNRHGTAVFDTATWELVGSVHRRRGHVNTDITFSSDGRSLALVSELGRVAIHHLDDGFVRTLATTVPGGGRWNVNSVEFTPDDRWIIVAGDGAAIVDVATGQIIGSPFPSTGLQSPSISGDGESLVTGTDDHLLVWDLSPERWREIACRAAGRNMTSEEWERYGWPDEPLRATCEDQPGSPLISES